MKILFDQGTPVPLRAHFSAHIVDTVAERGWAVLKNGELLQRAEAEAYDVFVTTDQNLRNQQNLRGRSIAILMLKSTSWPRISRRIPGIQAALHALPAGGFAEVDLVDA